MQNGIKQKTFCGIVPPLWLPPTLIGLLMISVYLLYLGLQMYAQLEYHFASHAKIHHDPVDSQAWLGTKSEALGLTVAFHVLMVLWLWSFLAAMFISPARIPEHQIWRDGHCQNLLTPADAERFDSLLRRLPRKGEPSLDDDDVVFVRSLVLVERKLKNGRYRYCRKCRRWKPDRAHHCLYGCNQCVLRMDHHCPWIQNCVGFHNYKHFLLFVMYGSIIFLFVMGAMAPRLIHVFRSITDVGYFFSHDLMVVLTYVFLLIASYTIMRHFLFPHIYLVVNAMTTLEYAEKMHPTQGESRTIQHRWAVAHAKYDRGCWRNWVHVLGPMWLWLLPISPRDDFAPGDPGTYCSQVHLDTGYCGNTYDPPADDDNNYDESDPQEEPTIISRSSHHSQSHQSGSTGSNTNRSGRSGGRYSGSNGSVGHPAAVNGRRTAGRTAHDRYADPSQRPLMAGVDDVEDEDDIEAEYH